MENPFLGLKSITPIELAHLKDVTAGLDDAKLRNFVMLYTGKRREAELILLTACIGLIGAAGIHRFLVGQLGMGLLFFFTGGLCVIGTILDIVNHKQLADEYNIRMADETLLMVS